MSNFIIGGFQLLDFNVGMTAVYLGNELVNVLLPLREPIAYANGIRLEFVSEKFRKRSIEVIAVHSPAFLN